MNLPTPCWPADAVCNSMLQQRACWGRVLPANDSQLLRALQCHWQDDVSPAISALPRILKATAACLRMSQHSAAGWPRQLPLLCATSCTASWQHGAMALRLLQGELAEEGGAAQGGRGADVAPHRPPPEADVCPRVAQ